MGTQADEIVRETTKLVNKRGRRVVTAIAFVGLLFLLVAIASGATAISIYKAQAERGTTLGQTVVDRCAVIEDPNPQVCAEAKEVVDSAPASVKGQKGERGEQGEPGPAPTAFQVQNAVASYCAAGLCTGADGANVTQEQVAQAVTRYCDSRGQCRGPGGAAGAAGQDGADGASGERGPGPTTEQVASGVASYCNTRNNCQGDRGATGATGATGETGAAGQPGDTVNGGSCQFSGTGTIEITIQTSNGPTTFSCSGTPASPGDDGGILE